ncbi:glycosyltransferase [Cellulosimicrobium sp. PMB13]|uniref:glycosyltransferase n=1 Tax=Cellulosimicrobium sp. PMB13 TaxID=3120158 RepID=UPI003F4AFB25
MTDLVVMSLEAWDAVWRRNQYLVTELLRADPTLRVLFVEPAADPLHTLSRRAVPRGGRGLRPGPSLPGFPDGRLWLFQPTKALPRRVDPWADRRLARATTRAARRLGMDRPVLWINDPSAASVLDRTAWPSLYDVTDDWLAADRSPHEHRRLVDDEELLLSRCAEVVVCSPGLERTKGARRDVTLVTNGVDLERYRTPHARPVDLPQGRVALYAGTVHPDRFDVPLLLDTARAAAGTGTVVLVGPVVDVGQDSLLALDAAGVVVLGARPWSEVPAYLQHADVLLVPHVLDAFTDSLDPIKAYEYRAVGRRVVATPVAGFRDVDDDRVVVAEGTAFARAVHDALEQPVPASDRQDVPTWRGQAALMAAVVDRTARHVATPR